MNFGDILGGFAFFFKVNDTLLSMTGRLSLEILIQQELILILRLL